MLESSRFLFGTGPKRLGESLPETKYITQDGTAGTYYFNFSDNPEYLDQVADTLYSATLRLKDKPSVFIIGAGGGNDMWAASLRDPDYLRAIELNKQTIKIHKEILPEYSRGLWENPNFNLVYGEGRVELARDKRKYDVIQMSAIDTWSSLASGAYVLAENYLYTREAIEDMLMHLEEDGMIQILRYAKEMEVLRLLSNTHAAFEELGLDNFENSVAVIYTTTVPFASLTVKPGGFTEEELASMHEFVERNEFSYYYMPDRKTGNEVDRFVRSANKTEFIEQFPRNIEPNTDNIPYFLTSRSDRTFLVALIILTRVTKYRRAIPFSCSVNWVLSA